MRQLSGPSKMEGMDIVTDAGIGEHISRGHGVTSLPPSSGDTASQWLARYAKRAASVAPAGSVGVRSVKLADGTPAVQLGDRRVRATLVMDGRTVLGLNKSVAGLVASGLSKARSVELAMNRLAAFRASKASDPKVVKAKRKKGRKR